MQLLARVRRMSMLPKTPIQCTSVMNCLLALPSCLYFSQLNSTSIAVQWYFKMTGSWATIYATDRHWSQKEHWLQIFSGALIHKPVPKGAVIYSFKDSPFSLVHVPRGNVWYADCFFRWFKVHSQCAFAMVTSLHISTRTIEILQCQWLNSRSIVRSQPTIQFPEWQPRETKMTEGNPIEKRLTT